MALFDAIDPDATPNPRELQAPRRIVHKRHVGNIFALLVFAGVLITAILCAVGALSRVGFAAAFFSLLGIGLLVGLIVAAWIDRSECPRCGKQFFRRELADSHPFDNLFSWSEWQPSRARRCRNCNIKLNWSNEEVATRHVD
jgi:hypothetical protein